MLNSWIFQILHMCGMMKMYFHLSCDAEVLLFENWVITKGENLAVSCFLVFIIGFGYSAVEQALNCLRKSVLSAICGHHGRMILAAARCSLGRLRFRIFPHFFE